MSADTNYLHSRSNASVRAADKRCDEGAERSDLIASLQRLGDAEHDDLSVAHDALAEIIRLRLDVVEKQDEIDKLRAALIAAMEIVQQERLARSLADSRAFRIVVKRIAELDAIIAQADAALGADR